MADPYADVGPDYLEQLLDAAIRAPAAATDPAGGRITAGLLVALAALQEDERVESYLSWGPGRPTVYEVRCYDQAEAVVGQSRHARAGEAIRATGVCAARPGHTARVVAIADDGEERWMMAVREAAAIYRVPAPEERPETPLSAAEVFPALRQLLADMTVHVDATAIEQVVREAMGGAGHSPAAGGDDMATDPEKLNRLVRAVVSELADLIPSADDIAAKVTRQMAARPGGPVTATPGRDNQRPAPTGARTRPTLPPPRPVPAPTPET